MKNFIDCLENEKYLEFLVNYYNLNSETNTKRELLNRIIKEVKSFIGKKKFFDLNKGVLDLLGTIYEKKVILEERKELGEFYTPRSVVDYILNASSYTPDNDIENKNLIDISCGSGSFLIKAARILIDRYKKMYKKKESTEFSIEEAKATILSVRDHIHGMDINPLACILCQINIHLVLYEICSVIKEQDKNFQLPLFNIENRDALILSNVKKYDYVVGNPPYLFFRDLSEDRRKIIENNFFETRIGQYDYYQLFIEMGIRILNDGGYLGYIVPDSLLALSNKAVIRNYIKNTTKIKEIYHSGPKFADSIVSNIILILQKERDKEKRNNNFIKIPISFPKNTPLKIIKQKAIENRNHDFLINLNNIDMSILDHLNNNFLKLGDLLEKNGFVMILSRGVELGKSGKVIHCDNCRKFYPLPKKELKCRKCGCLLKNESIEKIIREHIPKGEEEEFKLFLHSINRYRIKKYCFINTNKKGINYKDSRIYEDRIIIRQLSQNNRICATYDKNLSLTSQSFYNLKVVKSPIPEFNNYYLLGLINSQLLSFFFMKSFGSYKKLFPRILIEKIKTLPIKIPKKEDELKKAVKIVEKVKQLLFLDEKNGNLSEDIQEEINSIVFNLYQIPTDRREHILNFMKIKNHNF